MSKTSNQNSSSLSSLTNLFNSRINNINKKDLDFEFDFALCHGYSCSYWH